MSFLRNVILPGRRTAVIAVVFVLGCFSSSNAFAQSAAKLEIRTLSSRPDLVSGGDALGEVKAPAGVSLSQITLTLNGKDVTDQLKQRHAGMPALPGDNPDLGSVRGVISGMTVGDNTLRSSIKSSGRLPTAEASLKITNYPIAGPILSGPCATSASPASSRFRLRERTGATNRALKTLFSSPGVYAWDCPGVYAWDESAAFL